MREGAVRLRHPVRVFFLLNRLALALRGEDQLGGEPLGHALFAAGGGGADQPPPFPRGGALGAGFPPPPGGRPPPPPRPPLPRPPSPRQRLPAGGSAPL